MNFLGKCALFALLVTLQSSVANAQDSSRTFYVSIVQEATQISGELIGISEFQVETTFGQVTMPIAKIEAVRMQADGDGKAVIALTNGDMVSGKITLDELHVKTNWGKAHIKSASIESFSADQLGRFYTDPTAGGWRYSRATVNTTTRAGAGSGTRPGTILNNNFNTGSTNRN